jgi:hypothetical protein
MSQRDFDSIFAKLRDILQKHTRVLKVSADESDYYCLVLEHSPKLGKGFPVAWIRIGKRYVSYHFMPVYMFPKLRASLSKKLLTRMQGKSCFNFTAMDENLFEELDQMTTKGLAVSKELGFTS